MLTATLRDGKKAAPAIVDVEATVEHTTTVGGQDLTESIPTSQVLEEVANPTGTAVARRQTSALAAPSRQTFTSEGIEGDWGQEDLKFPQLKIVQGSGDLSKQFNNGEIVFGTSDAMQKLLAAPNPKTGLEKPIRFVPISIKKQYREKLSQDEQQERLPRIFDSIEEVEEAGLTTRWSKEMLNYAEPSGSMVMLIEQPHGAEDHPSFVLPFDGKNYTVAIYYAAGGAFRDSLRNIFNVALASLMVPILGEDGQPRKNLKGQVMKKPMLFKSFWTLNFMKKDVGGFAVWRPEVKLLSKEETSAEIREYCATLADGARLAADVE